MCISALKRIIGPRHLTNSEIECPFPLCQLELASNFMLPVLVQYSKHVRMNVELAMFVSKNSQCKPHHAAAHECAHANITCCLQGNRKSDGQSVLFAEAPDFFFYRLHLKHVVQSCDVSNHNRGRWGGRVHLRPLPRCSASGANHR